MSAATDPSAFDSFLGELESYYTPAWSIYDAVSERVADSTLVCDFGCGTGRLARRLAERQPLLAYLGYDRDQQRLDYARTRAPATAAFTNDHNEFAARAEAAERALLVAAFCVHDQPSFDELLGLISRVHPAAIVVWDITPQDLPQLTSTLRAHATTLGRDPRGRVVEFASALGTIGRQVEMNPQAHEIVFPSTQAISTYLNTFGLFDGADVGAVIEEPDREAILRELSSPFRDQRNFVEVVAR